jgi:hypothetical protein
MPSGGKAEGVTAETPRRRGGVGDSRRKPHAVRMDPMPSGEFPPPAMWGRPRVGALHPRDDVREGRPRGVAPTAPSMLSEGPHAKRETVATEGRGGGTNFPTRRPGAAAAMLLLFLSTM